MPYPDICIKMTLINLVPFWSLHGDQLAYTISRTLLKLRSQPALCLFVRTCLWMLRAL